MLDLQDLPDLDLRRAVVGVDELVPVLGGFAPYVNLDNAASTPPFRFVADTVQRFLPYYASVHRGSGYKSRLSAEAYEQARARIGEFVGADADRDVVVFGKNTTEAINVLARSLPRPRRLDRHHHRVGAPLERPPVARPRTDCSRARAGGRFARRRAPRRTARAACRSASRYSP